ncbi:hypothetical protein DYU05_19875 [Mucilaginibacter terrenus]|uniref:Uncharacterized protein n=1 Tax=Mucilaginibacter terrenus TaxID=2482727 RepID=A0A3E2NJZ5_9SPHI|nr:hypothetical protein DYU05_19875 [Mucilaginibacter terrenus]
MIFKGACTNFKPKTGIMMLFDAFFNGTEKVFKNAFLPPGTKKLNTFHILAPLTLLVKGRT